MKINRKALNFDEIKNQLKMLFQQILNQSFLLDNITETLKLQLR
jgi:hypothetical protein